MYSVIIKKAAEKYINKLDRLSAKRIRNAVDLIAQNPNIGEPLTNHTASI
jgi:mRNA-degrading endonuclease RelE of RelBE toxin-antitoxin system